MLTIDRNRNRNIERERETARHHQIISDQQLYSNIQREGERDVNQRQTENRNIDIEKEREPARSYQANNCI